MAVSVAVKKTIALTQCKIVLADITMDSTYPAGGEIVVPSDFGLDQVHHIVVGSPPLGGVVATWNGVGVSKIKLWESTTGTPALLVEVGVAHADVATAVVPVAVYGI